MTRQALLTIFLTNFDLGAYKSMLTLVNNNTGITHIILAAIHLNNGPGNITLNDDPPSDGKFDSLWAEVDTMKRNGVRVMGMLGGAAQGSFTRLDGSDDQFEAYDRPLLKMIQKHSLDGLDLDVEEEMSLRGIVRSGGDWVLNEGNLSGFDYRVLEKERASKINWYNAQFYNDRGLPEKPDMYIKIVSRGRSPRRVVFRLLTNPINGRGFVALKTTRDVGRELAGRYKNFGGVMGWEYFNAMPGGIGMPWQWAEEMTQSLKLE